MGIWQRLAALAAVLALVCGGVWLNTRPTGQLQLIFPDLAGDGVLLITPHGHTVMIDGSSDAVELTTFIGARLPFWQRSIDALVLLHADEERLPGALALARHYAIDQALLPPLNGNSSAQALQTTLTQQQTPIAELLPGTALEIDGVRLEVLHAAEPHAAATVLVRYGAFQALLAPAPGPRQAAELIAHPIAAALIWWPWDRPDSAASASASGAQIVVYSQGLEQTTAAQTLGQRGGYARRLLHKRLHGTITITSDGQTIAIQTQRQSPYPTSTKEAAMRRKTARAILNETSTQFDAKPRPITFGSDRTPGDRCTLHDAPARFEWCLDCEYRRGGHGLGILCGHRFGIDPTYVDGILTQIQDDSITPL